MSGTRRKIHRIPPPKSANVCRSRENVGRPGGLCYRRFSLLIQSVGAEQWLSPRWRVIRSEESRYRAANVGGRMIRTSAALVTTQLANVMPGAGAPAKLAYSAAAVAFVVYAVGFVASFWLPEPKQDRLPE